MMNQSITHAETSATEFLVHFGKRDVLFFFQGKFGGLVVHSL